MFYVLHSELVGESIHQQHIMYKTTLSYFPLKKRTEFQTDFNMEPNLRQNFHYHEAVLELNYFLRCCWKIRAIDQREDNLILVTVKLIN